MAADSAYGAGPALRRRPVTFWPLGSDVEQGFRRILEARFDELFAAGDDGFSPRWITPGREILITWRPSEDRQPHDWCERGSDLGFGAGIAQGYATLRQIGFSERSGYTAIGTVCNVAARLCVEAKDGQILLSQRVNVALKGSVATEQNGCSRSRAWPSR